MAQQPLPQRYGVPAQLGHWLTLLLLVGAFALGWIMSDMKLSPTRLKLFSYHKWIGVTVFGLALLRILWRQWAKAPALPAAMPRWERIGAHLSHWGLYGLLLAIPLSGWLMSSAKGFQTVYLGVLPIPDLIGRDRELGKLLESVHETLTTVLLFLVALHVAAALKHHFLDRDDVLARMLPGLKPRAKGDPQ
ncbi:cytochrome b [Solimonas sp. K1W22B-7]|uniref:cytochrome b n=1 Tax=Solimonas sp. K1W22B-7 TaxID=2303331 RepID=UPI001F09E669|nr:cytochrome b [Solimonas sp. K1W22B-7]